MIKIAFTLAQGRLLDCLAERYSGEVFDLTVLNRHSEDQTAFVFRAKRADQPSLIARLAADPARIADQAAYQAAVHARMGSGRFRVPGVIGFDAGRAVLLMEDGWGQRAETLWCKGGSAALRAMRAGGAWLARFHGLTGRYLAFNPDPHLNWLRKTLSKDDIDRIPDLGRLQAAIPDLEALGEAARGQPSLRCVTHRDFHLRNLIVRRNDHVYGLDFENQRRDDAVRDQIAFLTDALRCRPGPIDVDGMHAAAVSFLEAYGKPTAAPEVCRFFQLFQSLSTWAGLDESCAPLGPNRRRLLHALQAMSGPVCLLTPPPRGDRLSKRFGEI